MTTFEHAQPRARVNKTWCGADILALLLEGGITVFNTVGFIGSGPIAQAFGASLCRRTDTGVSQQQPRPRQPG